MYIYTYTRTHANRLDAGAFFFTCTVLVKRFFLSHYFGLFLYKSIFESEQSHLNLLMGFPISSGHCSSPRAILSHFLNRS